MSWREWRWTGFPWVRLRYRACVLSDVGAMKDCPQAPESAKISFEKGIVKIWRKSEPS